MFNRMKDNPSPSLAWLGNDGWAIAAGGHLIATDLDLHLPERMLPPFPHLEGLARSLDLLLVTHAHTDHLNPDTLRFLLDHGPCEVILAESCRAAMAAYGLISPRVRFVRPATLLCDVQNNPLRTPGLIYDAGDVAAIVPAWLSLLPIRAVHGHLGGTVYAGASPLDCGYVVEFGGIKIVQPGDSLLLDEHLSLRDVDVLFVSTTEHTMGVSQAAAFVEAVRPRRTFAQHFGTYRVDHSNAFWALGRPEALAAALPPDMRMRYTIPEYTKIYGI